MPQPSTGGPTEYYTRYTTPDMPHKMFLVFTAGAIFFAVSIIVLCVASMDPILTKKTYTREEWNATKAADFKLFGKRREEPDESAGLGAAMLPLLIVGFSFFGLSVCVMCLACVAYVAHFHYIDLKDGTGKRLPILVLWASHCCGGEETPASTDDLESLAPKKGRERNIKVKERGRPMHTVVTRLECQNYCADTNDTSISRNRGNSTLSSTLGHYDDQGGNVADNENSGLGSDWPSTSAHVQSKPKLHALEDLKPQSYCSSAMTSGADVASGADVSISDAISRDATSGDAISRDATSGGSTSSSANPLAHSTPLAGNTPHVTPARIGSPSDKH